MSIFSVHKSEVFLKKNNIDEIFLRIRSKLRQSLLYLGALRGVAQPGRASALGAECRQFESGYPDMQNDPLVGSFCIYQ